MKSMNFLQDNSFTRDFECGVLERFTLDSNGTSRVVLNDTGMPRSQQVLATGALSIEQRGRRSCDLFYQAWLRQTQRSNVQPIGEPISVVDLFSGCGGMSFGLSEASSALGRRVRHAFAAEHDPDIANVFQKNLRPDQLHIGDIAEIVDGVIGQTPTRAEKGLIEKTGKVDLLCGGPPCQGHSDLNNYTRRNDPRNSLYFTMARAAEILKPSAVIIENVPGVKRDRTGNFGRTILALEKQGYSVEVRTLNAKDYGVPQSRKRTFVFAAQNRTTTDRWNQNLDELADSEFRTPLWSIADLVDIEANRLFDKPSALSDESNARIDWLFDNSMYELADSMRPDCHRLKSHSYNSVYGRMRENTPAPTITTGFLVMGQGRFVHPIRRRTITPHEGARIQTFPDFFEFGMQTRGKFARMIGNAVPPLLAYYVGLASLDAILNE